MQIEVESVTIANAREVLRSVRAAMQGGDRVIDFSRVARCDTAAVACVLAWLRQANARGVRLELVAVPQGLRSLARLYGVESLIAGG